MTIRCLQTLFAIAALLSLAACGNDPAFSDLSSAVKNVVAAQKEKAKGGAATLWTLDAAQTQTVRQALEKAGQPVLLVKNMPLKFAGLMAVYGTNGPVTTWATEQYVSISTRDGILVATRGFGPDLMTSIAPSVGQISVGHGTVERRYYYLDGADQTNTYQYDCSLSSDGTETIAILGKTYASRKVSESCVGPGGSFTNAYWFDSGHKLRQSQQFVARALGAVMIQQVID